MLRTLAALILLSACAAPPPDLPREVAPIGDFRMGFNVVVANDVVRAPASREATEDELTAALRTAMEDRIGRFDGDGLYHIGLRIEAYSLGKTGIPILFAPRSVLLIAMNVWDDATQKKLTPDPIRITAYDTAAGPFIGGGAFRSREVQLRGLAWNAAREVEELLRAREDSWFVAKEGRSRVAFDRDPQTGLARATRADDSGGENAN